MLRIIRWVGHPSPLYDQNIAKRIMAGTLDPQVVLAFRDFEQNRKISVRRGQSILTLGRRDGLSRDYQWGPRYFDVEVEERDWHHIARNPIERHMFIDVTDGVPPFRPLLSVAEWRELMAAHKKYPKATALVPPGKW